MRHALLFQIACVAVIATAHADSDTLRLNDYTDRALRGVDISQLSWQAGQWRNRNESGLSWQYVSCPQGGMQLGIQQDIRGSETRFFEYQRYQEIDGGIVFFAQPLGRNATPFVLVELQDSRAVFENQRHDFPQRVILKADGDKLTGRIEGEQDGKPMSSEWHWRRIVSPGCD